MDRSNQQTTFQEPRETKTADADPPQRNITRGEEQGSPRMSPPRRRDRMDHPDHMDT